jgi:hypothetical protein
MTCRTAGVASSSSSGALLRRIVGGSGQRIARNAVIVGGLLLGFRELPADAATLMATASGETQSPIDGLTFAEVTQGGADPRIVAIHDEQDGNLADVHYAATELGAGSATYGRLSGEFMAQAKNGGPFSTSLVRAVGRVMLSFSDAAVVVSPTLAAGTPVTLTFRVDLSGSAFLTPGASSFPDNGASTDFEGRVTDLTTQVSVARFSGITASFVGPATQTMMLATQVGRSLELAGASTTVASVRINDNFTGQEITRTASALGTGRLFYLPDGDVTLQTESGHAYAVPAPLAADFDEDGDVDFTDLGIWKGAFALNQLGDADGDLDSDGADFLLWQQQLGSFPPAVAASANVPEPNALLLAALTCAAIRAASRRRSNV